MADEEYKQEEIGHLKPGSFVNVDGAPCQVSSIIMSGTGKHGHAKARVEVIGVLDGKKRIIVKPADARMEVPMIHKRNAQVLAFISENKAQVMDMESYETFEIDIPEEFKGKLSEGTQLMFWQVAGIKLIKGIKG